jgi:hypothetical protein
MKLFSIKLTVFVGIFFLASACQKGGFKGGSGLPAALKDVPAVRLNYRYEPDVPPPDAAKNTVNEERNAAVQNDFDQNRPQEAVDKMLTSPDGKRLLAVYHKAGDLASEFRLDMYTPDGKMLKKITSDLMAVHFPDTIRWSPDSSSVAFVAMVRGGTAETPEGGQSGAASNTAIANTTANVNLTPEANANTNAEEPNADANTVPTAPTPAAPAGILTFRTEQIYICNDDGDGTKPLTQNEGLIYFYYVWSPDSTMLAALAATSREWLILQDQADQRSEIFLPVGRPRLVEKNGRERRLDDALTSVQPVWSPDSAKVAAGFDNQVRIYDALGTAPTQAAIPLKNNLLLSSQAYDMDQQSKLNAVNTSPDANAQANSAVNTAQQATLPDPNTLVSYNPIVALNWTADDLLYFQTAFIKRMKNEADSVMSFPRWHRLVLTPQPSATAN